MATIVSAADLDRLQITGLEPGGFFVAARCPLCDGFVSLRLLISDVGTRTLQEKACISGGDGPSSFQLCARYSPEETDDPSGVDAWGEIEGPVEED